MDEHFQNHIFIPSTATRDPLQLFSKGGQKLA